MRILTRRDTGLINRLTFGTASFDDNAEAFIIAAGITDGTQAAAINSMVIDLKNNNLWTKFNAIYPFVGGTATTHKFNLINPADTDGAFRLLFVGGWTHSANGILPNGTNGYADTFFNGGILNDMHVSIYSRTNSDGLFNDIGNASNIIPNTIIITKLSNSIFGHINQDSNLSVANTDSRGLFTVSRTASNVIRIFRNNTQLIQSTTASTGVPNLNMLISAWNQAPSTITRYSNRELAFATIGTGLSTTEQSTFYNIVQTFQTTLGRQV